MDIFSHALWTNMLYLRARRYAWWGILFGVLPDIAAFGPFFIQRLFLLTEDYGNNGVSGFIGRRPELSEIPSYVFTLYNFTHSLIVFFAVFLIVLVVTRSIWWPIFGWGFHIAVDIFTHTSQFFPTPFLWPISNYKVSVVSWGHPIFLAADIAALTVAYGVLYFFKRRRTI